jgi:hypothetical protein
MWIIKIEDKNIKTFNINLVYDFITKNPSTNYNFSYNYVTLSKAEFLKSFLNISRSYDKYMELEKSLISKESKQKWLKITKQ